MVKFIKNNYITIEENITYKIKSIYIFLCYLVLNFCIYGPLCRKHYATDSYEVFYSGYSETLLGNGRILPYFISKLYEKFNVNPIEIQLFTTTIAIIITSIISSLLFLMLYKRIKSNRLIIVIIIFLSSLLSTTNYILLEWYLFPEVVLFYISGMFFAILAAKIFSDSKKNIGIFCITTLCALSSMYMYQININVYIIVVLVLIGIDNEFKWTIKSIKEVVISILAAFLAAIFSIITNKIIALSPGVIIRSNFSFSLIYNNILEVIKEQKQIWIDGFALMKYPWMILFVIVMIGLIIYAIVNEKNSKKDKFLKLLFIFCMLLVDFIVIFNPNYFVDLGVWLSPRVVIALPYFLSVMPIIAISIYNNRSQFRYQVTILTILVLLLIPNIATMQNIITDHFATNKLDEEYAFLINKEIENYEDKNNIQIKYIARINDKTPMWKYNGIDYMAYNVNVRSYMWEWSDVNLIKKISNRNFEVIDMDEEIYNEHFKDKDWNYFNTNEQLIFRGDTLYWCKY